MIYRNVHGVGWGGVGQPAPLPFSFFISSFFLQNWPVDQGGYFHEEIAGIRFPR